MASEAFAGVGTKFQRWDGAAWQDIAEVNSIDGPGMTKDVLEVTSLDTDAGYNEFITGFAEGGTLTLDMNFTRETYELMKEDFESDEVRSYRIQLPDYDSEPSTFTIEGLVIELPITMSADDKVTADVVIQITSQVVLDVGSTVPAEESEIPEDEWPTFLDDGHTLALLEFENNVSVVNTDQVTQWLDRLNSGRGLFDIEESSGGRPRLTANGILFNGTGEVLVTGAKDSWTWNQPAAIYIVYRPISWTANDVIYDGNNAAGPQYCQLYQYSTTPRILPRANSQVFFNDYSQVGEWAVVAVLFDGAGSWMIVNNCAAQTDNLGTRAPNGLTLGAAGSTPFSAFSNIEVAAVILRDAADSQSDYTTNVFPYLNDKYLHLPTYLHIEEAARYSVVLEFDEDLDTENEPDIAAFSVSGRTVTDVTVATRTVTLTISVAETVGTSRLIAYYRTAASGTPLMTAAGKEVAGFVGVPLVNNVTSA